MTMDTQLFIVDDDDSIRDALVWLMSSRGLKASAFPNAESFLEHVRTVGIGGPACLLLDVRMGALSGLALFDSLRQSGLAPDLRVIFLTGHGDIPMAVESLKKGAWDFFEKPFNNNRLVDRVLEALADSEAAARSRHAAQERRVRLASLTARELEVMERIVAGKLNKVIADELGITMRTVEVHRASIFTKMGAKSAVELVQLLNA